MKKKLSLLLILISVGLLTALAAGPVFGQAADGLGKADAARQKHTNALLANPNVVGVGLGYNADGEGAVVVYTTKPGVDVPKKLDDVPVQRVVTGLIVARCHSKTHTKVNCRPAPIGVSTGHPDITAGTIGARVKDGTGNVYALSNNHVYADINDASIGDQVLQQGAYDGGTLANHSFATLFDFERLDFSGGNNIMDAAIASSTTALLGNATLAGGYGTPTSTPMSVSLSQPVEKCGRTTGCTTGTVTGTNLTVNVCYKAKPPAYRSCDKNFVAKFVNQIGISDGSFSAGGDSGSLIVDENKNPVGLLFAGSSTRTIANRIGPVLSRFNVSIDGSAPPPTGTITGKVTESPDGTPAIGGARVETDTDQSATTANDGTYTITGVPTGSRTVTASADGFMPTNGNATVTEDVTTTKNFSLSEMPTGTISGTVTNFDTNGAIVGAMVSTDTGQSATTDGGGDYTIDNVPTGSLTVTASAGGFVTANEDTILAVGGTNTVDFSLQEAITGSGVMYVGNIDMFHKTKGRGELITTITIRQDDNPNDGQLDSPVSGATVNAILTRPDVDGRPGSWNFPGITNASGQVVFKLKFPISKITYTMCVKSVTHNDYTYDPVFNTDLYVEGVGACNSKPIE